MKGTGFRISFMAKELYIIRIQHNYPYTLMEKIQIRLGSNHNLSYYYLSLFNSSWIKYTGQFKDDNKDGFGTLFLSGNQKFEGEFRNDLANGNGSYDNGKG